MRGERAKSSSAFLQRGIGFRRNPRLRWSDFECVWLWKKRHFDPLQAPPGAMILVWERSFSVFSQESVFSEGEIATIFPLKSGLESLKFRRCCCGCGGVVDLQSKWWQRRHLGTAFRRADVGSKVQSDFCGLCCAERVRETAQRGKKKSLFRLQLFR